jgi:hypothetical protein
VAVPTTAGAVDTAPDYAEQYIELVRGRIAADDDVLAAARRRRDRVRRLAERFAGALRSYNSGSLAHGTVNDPVRDADCGIVLDRRSWPELGPDGDGAGPRDVVAQVAEFVLEKLREEWPAATCKISKRAIVFDFHEPIDDQDPSVDLIVGLTRENDKGLWIPNTETDDWDASDPEKHTKLLAADPADLRVFRARIIRLAKTAVHNDGDNAVLISFNVEALALDLAIEVCGIADGLAAFLASAAADIAANLTPDPANVSPPIKLPHGVTQDIAARRLGYFGAHVATAVTNRHDRELVLRSLGAVFGPQLAEATSSEKDALASALLFGSGGVGVTAAFGRPQKKTTSSFGA